MLGPPGALQRFGDLVLTVLAVRVAQLGQGEGIAFASDDGFENGHPRDARQVTHDLGEFEIHLLQGLVHMLNMVRASR